MAQIKLSGIVTKISGKLDGVVFGTSNNGSYVKANAYSIKSGTPAQLKQQQFIVQSPQMWRDTSAAEKTLWQNETANYPYFNKVGDESFYNAYQLFNFINANRILIGLAPALSPPMFVAPSAMTSSIFSGGPLTITLEYFNVLITDSIIVYATPPMPEGSAYNPSTLRQITIINNTSTFGVVDISSAYLSVFGSFVYPDAIYFVFKVVSRSTGIAAEKTAPKLMGYPS